jgi:transposase
VDTPEELTNKENVHMSKKPRRNFTPEQKEQAVQIVEQSGQLIAQVAHDIDLTASALR